jgi:hypothetical protein
MRFSIKKAPDRMVRMADESVPRLTSTGESSDARVCPEHDRKVMARHRDDTRSLGWRHANCKA